MNDMNARMSIVDAMVEANIVQQSGAALTYKSQGREYMVSIVVVDITGWEDDPDVYTSQK
jgi:hypothetical protein